jgi:hypothetical protein
MQMHVIATELGGDWAGPYTDIKLAQKILNIVLQLDPDAEIVSKESDPFREQIEAGLQPFKIHVDIIAGEPQLPAEVSLTWPPAETDGIQEGTPDYADYFAWAKNERDALIRLAKVSKAAPKAAEVEA